MVVRRSSIGPRAFSVLLVVLALAALRSIAANPNFQWAVVGQYLFSGFILRGLLTTIILTAVTMLVGIAIGLVLALMRLSTSRMLTWLSAAYVWFFRGTPQLVQLLFWYNLAALYPTYSIGIPFLMPGIVHGSVNNLITPFSAAILGLGLNEAAYMAEIMRAGLSSVDKGQAEAAQAIGMHRGQALRRIIIPQAMRFIVPPTGNQVIGMLKTTSLVSVIALADLLYSAQMIYSRTFQTIPLLIVACFWYLVVTTILSGLQHFVERRPRRQRPAR